MESLSILTTLLNTIKNAFSWLLRLFGKKVVDIDEYKTETFKVKMDYVDSSPKCVSEKKGDAIFLWSEYDTPGYERYFEVDGNVRKYFWNDSKQYLLIKRNSTK